MNGKKYSLKFNTLPVNIQQQIHCKCMHTYTDTYRYIHMYPYVLLFVGPMHLDRESYSN